MRRDYRAAQLAEEDATAEHATIQVETIEAQIAAQKSELNGMNDDMRELDKQLYLERLAMTSSVGQQLVEETLEAQNRKLIHDSALRTFAAVEDRLNEAKAEAEQMNSKSDAQRLQLTKLVREAQAARREAEAERQAAAVKQRNLREEVDEMRASISSLEEKLHTKQIQLGDRKRKAASARKVDGSKHAELSRVVALQEVELAQVRQELNACANASHVSRDTHGGQVHGAAMARRLAEQEVELLRQYLDEVVGTTSALRTQCMIAETESRKMQVKIARMRSRADSPTIVAEKELISTISVSSSAVEVSFGDYAGRRSPPRTLSPGRTRASPGRSPERTKQLQKDGPLPFMDIDALIQQVAEEHTRNVVGRTYQRTAVVESPSTYAQPRFSPPRSPVATAAFATSPSKPLPASSQPQAARSLFAPSSPVPNRQAIPEYRASPRSSLTVAFAVETRSSPPKRLIRQQTGPRQSASGGALVIPPRGSPHATRASVPPAPGRSGAAIAPRQPPEWSRQTELRPPTNAAEAAVVAQAVRGPAAVVVPRGRPGASAIAPRQPAEWSRQSEVRPSTSAAEAAAGILLRPPAVEYALGKVDFERQAKRQAIDRGPRDLEAGEKAKLAPPPQMEEENETVSTQAIPTTTLFPGRSLTDRWWFQEVMPESGVEVLIEVSEDEDAGFGETHFHHTRCIVSPLPRTFVYCTPLCIVAYCCTCGSLDHSDARAK